MIESNRKMSERLIKQLRLCKKANIPPLDNKVDQIQIPKGAMNQPNMVEVGGYYIIELASYITNPPSNFTLHDNWNNGVIPKERVMQCVVEKMIGKMVRINGIGYNRETCSYIDKSEWNGWIPQKSIEIIRALG